MSKKVSGFKKTLKRAMALLLVVVLTAGAVSVLGTGVAGYQYDSSDVYISTGGNADYGNDNDIDSDYSDTDYEEEGYYYAEEGEYEEDEYGLYGVLVPVPLYNGIIAATQYAVSNFAELQAAVANPIVTEIEILTDISDFAGAITIPTGRTITLVTTNDVTLTTQGNYRHFIVYGELVLTQHIILTNHDPAQFGGGIFVRDNAQFTMQGGIITGNRFIHGGGVLVDGTFIMYNGLISNNVATTTGGGVRIGRQSSETSGIGTTSGTFIMHDGQIIGNEAVGSIASGGGVALTSGTFEMFAGEISSNTASQFGGGVHLSHGMNEAMGYFTMTGGSINNNTASLRGGGVKIERSSVFTIGGTATITENNLTNTGARLGAGVSQRLDSANPLTPMPTLIMQAGSSITNNIGATDGGGVHVEGIFDMQGGTISDNTASQNGGGVHVIAVFDERPATMTMTGGTIENNTATQNGGGVAVQNGANFTMSDTALIYDNSASLAGGGVHITDVGTTFTMSNGLIDYNHVYIATESSQGGGGVFAANGAAFVMNDGTISNNTTNRNGGGVQIRTGATFNMNGGIIERNVSGLTGAGVHVRNTVTEDVNGEIVIIPTFNMTSGIIENNRTLRDVGGGVFLTSAHFEMSGNSIVQNNIAGNNGGGVQVTSNSTFIMHDGLIYGNISTPDTPGASVTSTFRGAGVSLSNNSNFIMHNGIIKNNTAWSGGGVRLTNATFTMHGGSIENNTASINAGGVLVESTSTFTAISGSITGNTATNYGGGIWTAIYDNITISDTVIFSGNTANAPHDHGIANRLSSTPIDATYSGGGQGGNPQNTNWATVSIPGTHALNNFDINYTGTPLFTLTVTVEDEDGNPIPGATVVIRNEDGDTIFTGITNDEGRVSIFVPDGEYEVTASHPDYDDVPPVDVVIDGTGETVVIVLPTPPHTVTFLPGTTATVTSMPSNRTVANGAQISTDGGTVATPTREGYTFLGWLQTIPAVAGNISSENVGNIAVTQDMTFVAQWQPNNDDNGGGDNGGSTPPPPPALIKNPDNRYVYVGDYIDWTLRNIHNYTSGAVANFSIVDMPGRGLNFASGRLPAFTNGTGITFDIRYTVAGSDAWHTYATGIDASQPFTFSLPQPGNLHYTNIGFFFGTVPAGFALGNEIVLTFLVSNDAPNNVLINRFALRYDNIAREGQGTAIVRPDAPPVGGVDNQVPTPETPQQPVLPEPPSITEPIYVPQPPLTAEQPQIAPTHGNEHEPATTGTGRVNPQTSDNFSPVGIIVSALGIIASLGAMVLISKKKKQAEI